MSNLNNTHTIGYTRSFTDDKLLKIEIVGESKLSSKYLNRYREVRYDRYDRFLGIKRHIDYNNATYFMII